MNTMDAIALTNLAATRLTAGRALRTSPSGAAHPSALEVSTRSTTAASGLLRPSRHSRSETR